MVLQKQIAQLWKTTCLNISQIEDAGVVYHLEYPISTDMMSLVSLYQKHCHQTIAPDVLPAHTEHGGVRWLPLLSFYTTLESLRRLFGRRIICDLNFSVPNLECY